MTQDVMFKPVAGGRGPAADAPPPPHRHRACAMSITAAAAAAALLCAAAGAGALPADVLLLLPPPLRTARAPAPTAKGPPQRLKIVGPDVFLPGEEEPTVFEGVDLMFKLGSPGMDHLQRQDRLLDTLLPRTNLVRLIMNHWDDDATAEHGDCRSENGTTGYVTPACLRLFDEVLDWALAPVASSQGGGRGGGRGGARDRWAIVTARSALAAGDGGPNATIFDNATLRAQWASMWGSLARRYSGRDRIAGYEVMSEPRTYAAVEQVHAAQQQACDAVWAEDPRAACVIGPARFYDRFSLNASYLLSGGEGRTIFAANFFAPRSWVGGKAAAGFPNATYGGLWPCCDLYQKDHEGRAAACGAGTVGTELEEFEAACADAPPARMDRAWLEDQLRSVLAFRKAFAAPCWVDQWGIHADAVGGVAAQSAYLDDLLGLFAQHKLHWTHWVWRRTYSPPSWTCDGYAVACETAQGGYQLNELLLHHLSRAMEPPAVA